MRRRCITIDRQYGSGGREVGRILSKKLDIPFYDGELLLLAAERFGLNPGLLKEKDEKRSGSLLHDIAIFANSFQNYEKMFEPYKLFEAVSTTICKLAMEGPAIFMGRCADTVLKDVCGSLNIFIYASSMEERISRIHNTDHIAMKNIEASIRKKDQQRREYYKMFAEKEWGKMENYDICLNTSSFGYEGCADVIAAMAGRSDGGGKKE
ncbi:MAG: cytidylate kinase-like family protein [Enterocloster asparagiformis]|nr:cytidylate kinase-like family protein [Enterocloster asparagiformis]